MKTYSPLILFFLFAFVEADAQVDTMRAMRAVLVQDSTEKNQCYFLRINKVKSIEQEEDDGSKTYCEVDRYGHETLEKWYSSGYLEMIQKWEYDQFGMVSKMSSEFFESSDVRESSYYTSFTYEIAPDGLSERLKESDCIVVGYENGKEKSRNTNITKYEYGPDGHKTRAEETGTRYYCTDGPHKYHEVTTFEYDSLWKVVAEKRKMTGGCEDDYIEVHKFTYEKGKEASETTTRNGKNYERTTTTYYANGMEDVYTSYTDTGDPQFVLEYIYDERGLIKTCKTKFEDEKSREDYTYEYY